MSGEYLRMIFTTCHTLVYIDRQWKRLESMGDACGDAYISFNVSVDGYSCPEKAAEGRQRYRMLGAAFHALG
jgi:hypothetical protein